MPVDRDVRNAGSRASVRPAFNGIVRASWRTDPARGGRPPCADLGYERRRDHQGREGHHYPGAPHGITATHQEESNPELLRFVES